MVPGRYGGTPVDAVELNPYAPRPFVFTETALCLRDSLRAAGWTSTHRRNEVDPQAYSIVLGALPPFPLQRGCSIRAARWSTAASSWAAFRVAARGRPGARCLRDAGVLAAERLVAIGHGVRAV